MISKLKQAGKLETIFSDKIPEDVQSHMEILKKLDSEYSLYAKNNRWQDGIMFSPKHIKDKSWEGLWLHATGMDLDLYINWLFAGYKYPEYKNNTLMHFYKEAHPKEKYVPYSIILANEDLKKKLNK